MRNSLKRIPPVRVSSLWLDAPLSPSCNFSPLVFYGYRAPLNSLGVFRALLVVAITSSPLTDSSLNHPSEYLLLLSLFDVFDDDVH